MHSLLLVALLKILSKYSLCMCVKDKCHTIIFDNDKKFAGHESIATELQTAIYFAHPYRSWEWGLNENSNGLFRQYFPKGMELTGVTEEQVQRAVERLNHRPRKILGFSHADTAGRYYQKHERHFSRVDELLPLSQFQCHIGQGENARRRTLAHTLGEAPQGQGSRDRH